DHAEKVFIPLSRTVKSHRRNQDSFFIDILAVGRAYASTNIDVVRNGARKARKLVAIENGRSDINVRAMPRPNPWVVRYERIAGLNGISRKLFQNAAHDSWHAADVARRRMIGLRQHAALMIENSRGAVPVDANDRRERSADQRLHHLIGDGNDAR